MIRKLIAVLIGLIAIAPPTDAANNVRLSDETLTYDVIYKWGFINKVAGYATMSLRSDGEYYKASVFAENAPWADNIYMLRDTLYSTMTKDGYYPVAYTYIAHENGKYKKDILTFHRNGNTFTADATRYKRKAKGEATTSSSNHLEAQGMTVDMLSSFFYLRTLDFQNMKKGQSVTVNIFSGSKKEKLKIAYLGMQKVSVGGRNVQAYHINFTFTRRGVESSSPISAWISSEGRRIPLKVEGKLPVGKVRAIYTGPNP